MSDVIRPTESGRATGATLTLDAMIIGTGVAGLYELHLLRQQGLSVMAFDTASDVGGTWYWNRYPGARFDSESYIYQYLFSEDLYKGWSWSEKFPGQPEIERWMHYVVDRLDLRKDIRFDTTVTEARFDEAIGRWRVKTDRGDVIDTRYLITCCGMLSAPLASLFPGQEDFEGTLFHTARWPKTPVDLSGKRVGVVGIGATGIQVIQTIADQVGHLTVFARTPQYTLPMKNPAYGPAEQDAYKARFRALAERLPNTVTGFEHEYENGAWADRTPEERQAIIDETWRDGSLKLWLASFAEIFTDAEASEAVSEFVRAKMRERLKDPRLCEILIPSDYGFGTHRVPLERGFLEVFHRPNVTLVGLRQTPIAAITPKGIRLADGTEHALDVIILATGFDAGTGALTRIDIRGRDGRSLKEEWSRDIRTTMGLQVHGYPNLFMTGAPLAPSAALCNMTTCLQQQAEWISDCIAHMRSRDVQVIEATKAAQDGWVAHHDALAEATLVAKTQSWYTGSNVPGKPRRLLSYIGGVGTYRQKCTAVAEHGYPGFTFR
ncbi:MULTISPECIES: flavin-containing monooxygenase [unclassified Methylobacterium]|jgi:acetone monooxygenase (methyl acetate-forming)|uniref:flavin-containing monooxygenase n=1 Tax=unclassified Methylobacterium TaxID=2615210 RepID=UPI00135211AF|nr:NAD(P)/FAD-dependent oxidoreductase [Methylobacterium sp. 2A]MWV24792.1 NAD(P)/FAD-dependent oxidoreductase [Methylobacterium sp. 2A]